MRAALFQRAEAAMLEEKAAKLFGITRLLDAQLGPAGFEGFLHQAGLDSRVPREEQIAALNRQLGPGLDQLLAAFPNVAAGFYSKRIGAILVYGPSGEYQHFVGIDVPSDHLGRQAMAHGREQVGVGAMMRGDILNCMHPLMRAGETIGFTFANETVAAIYRQMYAGARRTLNDFRSEPLMGLAALLLQGATTYLTSRNIPTMRQMAQYLELYFNNLPGSVCITDQTGQIIFASQCWPELTGVSAGQGQHWSSVAGRLGLPPLTAGQTITSLAGVGREVELTAATLRGPEGEVLGYLYLLEDAKQMREQEAYLARTERLAAAGELAAAIAHEVRNPLTIVAGSLQLLPQRLDDPQFLLSLADIAGEELARVDRTISGLLTFSRYAEPHFTPLDLNELITQTADFIRWYAKKNGVEVTTKLEADLPWVQGDPEHLRQALVNLFMNGIQAMPDGGRLSLTTQISGRWAQIKVTDEGVGIPPELIARVFDVFFSTKSGGTGLGLPLVQRIIDEHRGRVGVESIPGQGTTFTLSLPLPQLSGTGRESR